MQENKTFDCVAMKAEVQARMHRDFDGLSDEEERARMRQELETSTSVAARKWRALQQRHTQAASESRTTYRG